MLQANQEDASALAVDGPAFESVESSQVFRAADRSAGAFSRSMVLPDEGELGRALYRFFEWVVAAVLLTATLPVMVIIGLIVKLGTPGPVLFFQKRVGRGGRTFHFVKFRTMYADARQRFPELYRYEYTEEAMKTLVFKLKNDPRHTPQGRWLRKTSLDELPNFWNVLTGDMALVGPRPEIPEMLRYYKGVTREKFSVRPGVTGLAQICGRGNLKFQETLELDLQYVKRRSVWLDLWILASTVPSVMKGRGSH